jgi:hypothetical protein
MSFDPEPRPATAVVAQPLWRRVLAWRPRLGVAVPKMRWRWWLLIPIVPVLYYTIGMLVIHTIDDNVEFRPQNVPPGESRAVAAAAALVTREVDTHRWVASDPFFLPAWPLDNMPNFQMGIMAAVARFTTELKDQLGRTRGSSQIDRDLQEAAGQFQFRGDRWVWDPQISIWPSATSAQQYRAGYRALIAYNKRLAAGQATYDRRADNLQSLLERFANDLGSESARLDQHIAQRAGDLFDMKCDDIFYSVKGRLYATFILLRELGEDFKQVIADRQLTTAWAQMLDSFRTAAHLQPIVVLNGRPDSMLMPSHLASQGFYLMRARTQLREIVDILQK